MISLDYPRHEMLGKLSRAVQLLLYTIPWRATIYELGLEKRKSPTLPINHGSRIVIGAPVFTVACSMMLS